MNLMVPHGCGNAIFIFFIPNSALTFITIKTPTARLESENKVLRSQTDAVACGHVRGRPL